MTETTNVPESFDDPTPVEAGAAVEAGAVVEETETPADDARSTSADVEPVPAPTEVTSAPAEAAEGAPATVEPVTTDAEAVPAPAESATTDAEPVTTDPDTADAEPVTTDAGLAAVAAPATSPAPAPRPVPRPIPRAIPRPPATPAAVAAVAPSAPILPPADAAEAAHAATFGRVDADGTVYVREADAERAVGQFPDSPADEALTFYVRRFLDLHAKVAVFEQRLTATDLSVKEIDSTLAKLTEESTEPSAVGDLVGLRARLDALRAVAAERRAVAEAERAAAKEVARAARTAIVEEAEKIASTDAGHMQWRPAGERLRELLDQWKTAQQSGPRIDRPSEDALWKRFSHARTSFDRERRHFFAELESRNSSAKLTKEALVAEAERLATSTDWGQTAGDYRDLMAQWKAAGRASRKDDDALWARFRLAQDAFFAARDAANAATDEEFAANLAVKERLLIEAEKLVPVTDLNAAKTALRTLQDRWDAAGKVPRGDIQRVEGRIRAVETAIRDADQSAWKRSNPETKARAEGAAAQLEAAIAGLEEKLAKAQAQGDKRKITEAQAALDARKSWLEQVQRAAADS